MVHSIFGRAGATSLRLSSRNSAQNWAVELVWWENGLCSYCTTHTRCYICAAAKNLILPQPSLPLLLATLCPLLPLKAGPLWHQRWPRLAGFLLLIPSKSRSHVSFPSWQSLGHQHVSNCKEAWEIELWLPCWGDGENNVVISPNIDGRFKRYPLHLLWWQIQAKMSQTGGIKCQH